MASNRNPPQKRDSNKIIAAGKPGEDEATAIARTVLRPSVQAAVTLKEFDKFYGDLDLSGLIDSLNWRKKMANSWTPERRARQAKLIQRWRSRERSTGPRTQIGKEKVSSNAFKGGARRLLRELSRAIREQNKSLQKIQSN